MKARNAKFGLLDHDLVEGWDIYQSPPKKVSPIIGPFFTQIGFMCKCQNYNITRFGYKLDMKVGGKKKQNPSIFLATFWNLP